MEHTYYPAFATYTVNNSKAEREFFKEDLTIKFNFTKESK